ncbi:MAG: hypothetical protein IKZ34_02815 [Alphaproteobacteria bacterium]|nr:hypothetical protein [Alphaproteobacteria bacterium]
MKKTVVTLAFLSVFTPAAFAAETKIATAGYVEGAVIAAAEDATTKANVAEANAKSYTDGKYGKIPTSSNGTGTATIWVE